MNLNTELLKSRIEKEIQRIAERRSRLEESLKALDVLEEVARSFDSQAERPGANPDPLLAGPHLATLSPERS
ncbi:MAG: hypothetical protein ACE5JX_00035 [Acidobacteriota bacterium]